MYFEFVCNFALFYTEAMSIEHIINFENTRLSVNRFNLRIEALNGIESILLIITLFTQVTRPSLFTFTQFLAFVYRITVVQKLDHDNFKIKMLYKKVEVFMFTLMYLLFVYVTFFKVIMKDENLGW